MHESRERGERERGREGERGEMGESVSMDFTHVTL
jgi:hypothetical protein